MVVIARQEDHHGGRFFGYLGAHARLGDVADHTLELHSLHWAADIAGYLHLIADARALKQALEKYPEHTDSKDLMKELKQIFTLI